MKKGKIVLTAVAVFALIGGALAFKATRVLDVLYYSTTTAGGGPTCKAVPFRTTTTTTIGTVAPPISGIGWFTTSLCNAETFKALPTEN